MLNFFVFVDVLILDDNSPDGTRNTVLKNKKKYKDRLHLINREKKQGLGKAYIEGFKWALKKKYFRTIFSLKERRIVLVATLMTYNK